MKEVSRGRRFKPDREVRDKPSRQELIKLHLLALARRMRERTVLSGDGDETSGAGTQRQPRGSHKGDGEKLF